MVKALLIQNIGVVIAAWVLVYLSDYYLTLLSARYYRSYLQEHMAIAGSYELTPVFQKDVDALRLLSPAFLLRLALSVPLILAIWFLAVVILDLPQLYTLAVGGLFLREAVVHLRHFRTLALIYFGRTQGGLHGRLEQSRALSLQISATEVTSFAVFFILVALVLGSWAFLGGAIFCLATGLQHWRLAEKARI